MPAGRVTDSLGVGSFGRFLCRRGRHRMRQVSYKGNLLSSDRRAKNTFVETLACSRGCGHTETVEHFNSRGYWADVKREREDERLKRIIREATR